MEYNKYTGLKYILPVMHLIIIDNNYCIKKLSVTSVIELIDVFNKYGVKQGKGVSAGFNKNDFEEVFLPDYELDNAEGNIIIKDTSRERTYIEFMYLSLPNIYNEIVFDKDFMNEAKKVIEREIVRQRYVVAKDEWIKSSNRLNYLKSELEKAIVSGDNRKINYYQEQVNKCKKVNSNNYFKKVKLSMEACNHLLVQTSHEGEDVQIERIPYFYRRRFEYRCLKCGLTNKVYLGGDKDFFGPVGEIMWDLTEDLSGFSSYIYNELNNTHIISKPEAIEKIYNELNKYPASNNKSNFELIKGLREKVEEIEKGTSRVRGEK